MGEVHLFIVWSSARGEEQVILRDLSSRYRVLDLIEVSWTPESFRSNLRCLYGTDLPPNSDKERESGTGPFLVVVVEDLREDAGRQRLADRQRYRAMTGGGYRVHASADTEEAARDLVLLFGRRPADFLGGTGPVDPPRQHRGDVIGAHGWRDLEELLLALEVTSGCRVLPSSNGVDATIEVDDLWWAREVLRAPVLVDGRPLSVEIVERRRPTIARIVRRAVRLIPWPIRRRLHGAVRRARAEVRRRRRPRWGNLRRATPFSDRYGFDRGTPIDRFYLDRFFSARGAVISGRVLEVKDLGFTTRYGGDVSLADVLDIDHANVEATVLADLAEPGSLPASSWDAIVVPQTLQYVDDLRAATANLWQALRPGGTLLVTVPCVARREPVLGDVDRWRILPAGLDTLLRDVCTDGTIEVLAYGSLLTSVAFLLGLAADDLKPEELERRDADHPLLACGCVRRPG
jgi:hypothetical protein